MVHGWQHLAAHLLSIKDGEKTSERTASNRLACKPERELVKSRETERERRKRRKKKTESKRHHHHLSFSLSPLLFILRHALNKPINKRHLLVHNNSIVLKKAAKLIDMQ